MSEMDDHKITEAIDEMKQQMKSDFSDTHPTSELTEFYADRCVLVTGVTGFVGKAITEKLVRTCTKIKRVYLLIRDKHDKNVDERLAELYQSDCFNRIRSQPGGSEMLENKLYAIKGDITMPNFGISPEDMKLLSRDVSIVFNSAASVNFAEPLNKAVKNNVYSVSQLVAVSNQLENLEAVVQVSTAYSNFNRGDKIEEIFYDPPMSGDRVFQIVDYMHQLQDTLDNLESTQGGVRPALHVGGPFFDHAHNLIKKVAKTICPPIQHDVMDIYTREALKRTYRPNTYTFTKAIAESFLLELAMRKPERYLYDKIPVAVVRPSIIAGAWREPEAGFVDSYTGPSKANLDMSTGALLAVPGAHSYVGDMVPIDMVANNIIAVGWFLVTSKGERMSGQASKIKSHKGGYVFNMVTGYSNPGTWGIMVEAVRKIAYKFPSKKLVRMPTSIWVTAGWMYKTYMFFMEKIPLHIMDLIDVYVYGKEWTKRTSFAFNSHKNMIMLDILGPFSSHQWNFCDDNTRALLDRLSPVDRDLFLFDVKQIDWVKYMENYMIGVRTYLLKDDPLDKKSIQIGRQKLKKRQKIYRVTMTMLFLIFYYFCMFQTSAEQTLLSLVGF